MLHVILLLMEDTMNKTILISAFLAFALTACDRSDSPSGVASATPVEPTSPAVIVPPIVPPTITYTWPPAGALSTDTRGGYSCSVTSNRGVGCFDGTNAPYIQPAPYIGEVDSVLIGDGIVCAMLDSVGAPDTCSTNLLDPACSNGPNSAGVVCWTPATTIPVLMNVNAQFGYTDQSLYNYGPATYSIDGSGNACITESIYDASAAPYNWITDVSACGKTIGTGGTLLP